MSANTTKGSFWTSRGGLKDANKAKAERDRVRPGRLTSTRLVPDHIVRPHYVLDPDAPSDYDEPMVKSARVIEGLRTANRVAAEVLNIVGAAVRPGITADELDRIGHEATIARDAYPSPLMYSGYPKSLCTSVNEVICHGIPDSRELVEGDIVNIDVSVYIDGAHGDTSRTFFVGEVDEASRDLVNVTRDCLTAGIQAVIPGKPVSDIGKAIQKVADAHGYGIVRAFVGHGIGTQFHSDPQVHHYASNQRGPTLVPGMTFTIEPMITMGTWKHRMWDDGWTAVTTDLSRTAQFEHTMLVTETGVELLSVAEGTPVEDLHGL